jgi:hypothetical protein
MVYKWKYGVSGISAQSVGEYLESVEKRDGKISQKTIVGEARPEGSLLHAAFEWDDNAAAELYREYQAGQIIRSLVVVQAGRNDSTITTRAIVSVTRDSKPEYISVARAMEDEGTREQLLENALAELNSFKAKYRGLSELAGIFKEIDKLAG